MKISIHNLLLIILLLVIYYSGLTFFFYNYALNFFVSEPKLTIIRFLIGLLISLLGLGLFNFGRKNKANLSTLFYVFQLSIVVIPGTIFVSLQIEFTFWICFFILISLYGLKYLTSLNMAILNYYAKRKTIKRNIKLVLIAPLVIWVSVCFIIVMQLFFKQNIAFNNILTIDDMNGFRTVVFNKYKTIEFISIYVLAYFLIPILLLYSTWNRKIIFTIIVLTINFILFLLTGVKTYFFMPFFTIFIFFLLKEKTEYTIFKNLILSIILILAFGYLIGIYFDTNIPNALFLRSVFEPSRIHIIWIDFFYDKFKDNFWVLNPPGFVSYGGLVRSEIIASNLGGSVGNGEGANAGFVASSFATYGFFGLFIHIFILSLIMAVLNFVYKHSNHKWIAGSAIPCMFLLTNISFVGAVFYYGLMFSTVSSICLGAFIKDYRKNAINCTL